MVPSWISSSCFFWLSFRIPNFQQVSHISLPKGGSPYRAKYSAGATELSRSSNGTKPAFFFGGLAALRRLAETARPFACPSVLLEATVDAVCRIGEGLVEVGAAFFGRVIVLVPKRGFTGGAVGLLTGSLTGFDGFGCDNAVAAAFDLIVDGTEVLIDSS